ncbi:DedA family protein [Jannaschia sp. 2305UL9-9]|uniref:DedA family protein n=1 Tax=Jannaschia sp. 2305UL9-9 TaxID=3121638 RepID=UPI003528F940
MTEAILAAVPHYGIFLVFAVVFLACLAVPLPSSLLVLTAGSFAASGDLALIQVLAVAFGAFVLGDQVAYQLGRWVGGDLLARMRRVRRMAPLVERSERLLHRRGAIAVLLSHTIFSPTCPYVSYLCGAGGLARLTFTLFGTIGAAIWAVAYVALGHVFAAQLAQVATIVSNGLGVILAISVALVCVWWLRSRWRHRSAPPLS